MTSILCRSCSGQMRPFCLAQSGFSRPKSDGWEGSKQVLEAQTLTGGSSSSCETAGNQCTSHETLGPTRCSQTTSYFSMLQQILASGASGGITSGKTKTSKASARSRNLLVAPNSSWSRYVEMQSRVHVLTSWMWLKVTASKACCVQHNPSSPQGGATRIKMVNGG